MTAWIITKDKIADHEDRMNYPEGGSNFHAVGMIGPRTASEEDVRRLRAGEGIKFRLKDDDGNVYYYGRRLEQSDADEFEFAETELAPLDNFGSPNAGCTIQEEKNADGKWEAIN